MHDPDPTPDGLAALRADLESLRRRCRTLTVVAVGALVVAGLALLGQRLHGEPHRGVVEANLFAVLDRDGKPRAALDLDPDGHPRLALMTAEGTITAQLVGLD